MLLTIRLTGFLAAVVAVLLAVSCNRSDGSPVPASTPTSAGPELPFRASTPFNVPLMPGYRIEGVLDGLDLPAAIAATPDGRLLIGEQTKGRVRIFRDGVLESEPWVEVPVSFGEGFMQELGLVGIAVDPLFETNRYVYLYYTTPGEDAERKTVLERYRDVDGVASDAKILLEIDRMSERSHVAGGMTFAGDALFLGIGDHEDMDLAQQLDVLPGKILRIDREGNPMPDNPFVEDEAADPRLYAYGVRNPFGLATDLSSGSIYFTDNRDYMGDAVYELRPGVDYGWPYEPLAVVEPLVIYDKPYGVAGAVFYDRDELPELKGSLLYCSYHYGGTLHWSDVSPDLYGYDLADRDRIIASGCSSAVTVGADGFVYFLSYGSGRLMRISREM